MLVEDKNANGTANTAPIKVPIKAIQIVSNNNAGTSVNSIFTSGCIIPDNTFFAISTPFDIIQLGIYLSMYLVVFLIVFLLIFPYYPNLSLIYLLPFSIIKTVMNSITRIIPTLSYSLQPIFSFNIRPIPPAPTYPSIAAALTFISKL